MNQNHHPTIQSLLWRAAVKNFDKQKKVSPDTISTLLEGVRLTPSSFGLQAWKVLVIESEEIRKNLLPMTFNQPQVTECSHYLVFLTRKHLDEEYVEEFLQKTAKIKNLTPETVQNYKGMILGFSANLTAEQQTAWLTRQAYIALGNCMTLAALAGVDSCPIEGFLPQEYDNYLKVAGPNYQSCVCLALGYRSEKEQAKPENKFRRSQEELFIHLK